VKYSADKLPVRQLIFGDGGGFAGIETSYVLLENGQVFKKTGVGGAFEELASVKTNDARAFFEKLAALQLYKLDMDKPGNLYYFLQDVNKQTDSRVVWGAGDYTPPQAIVGLYKELKTEMADRKAAKKTKKTAPTPEEKKKKEDEDATKW
jgi:hypothetical protein